MFCLRSRLIEGGAFLTICPKNQSSDVGMATGILGDLPGRKVSKAP